MNDIFSSPFFGIILCAFAYAVGIFLNKKLKSPLANPLLIGNLICILTLTLFKIPLEDFNRGGDIISLFMAPATASLAVSIYRQLDILKKNLLPVILGCAAGSAASMLSVYGLCRLFRLDEKITASLLPKSVTMPIAMPLSESLGGITSVTAAAVVITGIAGAILAPYFIKIFRIGNSVAAGVGIGSCSHALGTTKAIEIGEIEGAMSGIAIGVSGFLTVIFSMFIK